MSLSDAPASPDLIAGALGSSGSEPACPPRRSPGWPRIAALRDRRAGDELVARGPGHRGARRSSSSGRVALRTLVPERGMVTILTVEPGDVVGWSAVVPPHRATSTGIAIEPVTLLELPGERLRQLLRADHAARCVRLPARAPGRRPPPVGHAPPAPRPVRARGVGTARGAVVVTDERLPYAPYPRPTGTAVAAPPAPVRRPGTAAARGSSPGPTWAS